jgi:chromosome segregation ATPase
MATSEPTRWSILAQGAKTFPLGGAGLSAQLQLATEGPTSAIVARVEQLGAVPVRQRLRESMASHERLQLYGRLKAEADGLSREINGLSATLARTLAERAETLALAVPGFSRRVVEIDQQAGELQNRIAQARKAEAAIGTAIDRARHEAMDALRAEAATVHADAYRGLLHRRESVVQQLPDTVGPLLSELAAVEKAILTAASGSLAGDLVALLDDVTAAVEEAAAVAATTEGATNAN